MRFPQQFTACCTALCIAPLFAATPAEHQAEKDRINAEYQAAKAHCRTLHGNAKNVCEEQARGQKKVDQARWTYQVDATERNRQRLAKTRADADYALAKAKCEDLAGNAKDVCKKDAHAAHVKAVEAAKVADVQAEKGVRPEKKAADVSEAKRQARQEVRDAEYQAARERCDNLAGDAKDRCIADAKRLHGK